jgi:hypothetical protein
MSGIPDYVPDWIVEGDDPPDNTPVEDLWPEDVIDEDEWNRGWFNRKLAALEIQAWERAITPRWLGGDADDPPSPAPGGRQS